MVIIGGTSLKAENLPLCDLVEYVVEENEATLGMKLKTIAKSPTCVKVYLHVSQRNIVLMPAVVEKTEYFNDDKELIDLLQNSSDGSRSAKPEDIMDADQQADAQKEEEQEVDVPDFNDLVPEQTPEVMGTPIQHDDERPTVFLNKDGEDVQDEEKNIAITAKADGSSVEITSTQEVEIPTVDTDLPEAFLTIPSCGEDIDSLKLKLQAKDELLKQKDGTIAELRLANQELFDTQEKELLDICSEYEKKVDEANATIATLKEMAQRATLSEEDANFLKYMNYAKNCKGALREGMPEIDKKVAEKLRSQVTILAAGAGDSLYSMMFHVSKLIESRNDIVFVDMINDSYLAQKFRWRLRGNVFSYLNDGVAISDIVKQENGCSAVLPGTVYNDIALLTIDWVKFLTDVQNYAKGKKIVFLFGNINSFSVRYTVEKLATIGQLFVIAKASPLILTSSYSDLKFIPNNKVKLIVLDYIDVVKAIVTEINKNYAITAFSKGITWEKLGIK